MPTRHPARALFLTLPLIIAVAHPALAAWPNQPTINLPVCRAADYQWYPVIASDGAGGAIVAWYDVRGGVFADIYAQHVLASGVVDPAWPADGRALCTAAGDQFNPTIVADGAGGAIVCWVDSRSGTDQDIYAQHVLSTGVVDPAWPANGRALCTAAIDQNSAVIVSDGSGGAIVAWQDSRSGTPHIYARRVSAAGAALWTADGVAICTAVNAQFTPAIAPDGAGGAIMSWDDNRNGVDSDVYTQHVLASGTVDPAWTANGVAISIASNNQLETAIASDGGGGAWIAYKDRRGLGGWADIYASHVLASGLLDPEFNAFGREVCTAIQEQNHVQMVPDGSGGAIVTWQDLRNFNEDIYAHHLTGPNVDPNWPTDGLAVCTDGSDQSYPALVSDGAGGALIVWMDRRINYAWDVYAQHVLASGTTDYLWPYNGRAICTASGYREKPVIAADETGGAVLAWFDQRLSNNTSDIYAQRVEAFGRLGNPEPAIASVKDVPNDQGGHVKLSWAASYLDAPPYNEITQYEVWRSIPPAAARAALAGGAEIARAGSLAPLAPGRAIRTSVEGAQIIYWEYVATQPAHRFAGYSYDVPTASDSVGAGNPTTQLLVVADDWDNRSFWNAAPASGYSVDNLPPSVPAPFTGAYSAGATHLHWGRNGEADLAGYRLYRGSSAGFTPGPGNLIGSPPDTGFADPGAAGSYYKLSAIDSHGNQSGFALLGPSGTLDAGGTPPTVLAFERPSPNPAFGAAMLRFSLPREARVTLAIYDASGRRVRTLAQGVQPAGNHTLAWDLRDDAGHALGAGLYFVALDVEGQRLTHRIATLR